MENKYFVYIVRCNDGSYYTGQTNNLDKRIKQHNKLLKNGAKYTRGKSPVVLVFQEIHATRNLALKREYALKKLTKNQKEHLINSALISKD